MKTLMFYICNSVSNKNENGLLLTNRRFFISGSQEFDLGADFRLGEIGFQIHSNRPALRIHSANVLVMFCKWPGRAIWVYQQGSPMTNHAAYQETKNHPGLTESLGQK